MTASTTTATDLANFLGTVKESVDSYNEQRRQLADSLRQIISNAQQLLTELGETAGATGRRRGRPPGAKAAAGNGRRKRGRPKGSGKGPGRPKGRKMSAEARAKIAAAQKARWAKQKAGK